MFDSQQVINSLSQLRITATSCVEKLLLLRRLLDLQRHKKNVSLVHGLFSLRIEGGVTRSAVNLVVRILAIKLRHKKPVYWNQIWTTGTASKSRWSLPIVVPSPECVIKSPESLYTAQYRSA